MSYSTRAVVIVSGGAAISPFTSPDVIAQQGMAAGSTDTYLRQGLLDAGFTVFTSPASMGGGPALEDTGFSGFSDPAITLPAELTVNCVGPIDDAGQRLVNFLEYVNETFGITTFDLIGHSMGGLFSRASIHELTRRNSSLTVGSLATIGTPWQGSFAGDYTSGEVSIDLADGDPVSEAILRQAKELFDEASEGAGEQVTYAYVNGENGWNQRHAGKLDDIDVLLIGGDYLKRASGDPLMWPHDGLVSLASALAQDVSTDVLPRRQVATFDGVHSIYFADALDLPWDKGLTWDPAVLERLVGHLSTAQARG
jgi:pimeloyl-ACP methyl ester carboxylesterase